MCKKKFFSFLILLGLSVSGYFSIQTLRAIYKYYSLAEQAEARIFRWEIHEKHGKFPITAFYSFKVQDKMWTGETQLTEPLHLNETSATLALRSISKQPWTVWFRSKNPKSSSIEHIFPTGLLFRTFLGYAVTCYFIFFLKREQQNSLCGTNSMTAKPVQFF